MKEKIGEILGGIFEHKILYICSIIFDVITIIGFAILSFHFYGKQLDVIVASHYQLDTIGCALLSIIMVFVLVEKINLKHLYDERWDIHK